jgi:hypothetical protein
VVRPTSLASSPIADTEITIRAALQRAPTWVHVLINGGLFFVLSTLLNGAREGDWATAATSGALSGVLFGLIVGPINARRIRRAGAATSDLPEDATRRAHRAAFRGPVPRDEEVRAAAIDLARQQRDEAARFRILGTVVLTLLAVLSAWLAVDGTSPWFWLSSVLFLGLVVQQWWYPRYVERRIERLEAGPAGTSGGPV